MNRHIATAAAATLVLAWAGCGDKDSGKNANNTANQNNANAVFCESGTADCACAPGNVCTDDAYSCVDGKCVVCAHGDETCACKDDGTCNAGLACVSPDPTCTVLCDPPSCQPDMAGDACDGQALCDRTINECMETITEAQCLDFYGPNTTCTDIAAYTACNCDCITQETCMDYFACGTNCFNDHCM